MTMNIVSIIPPLLGLTLAPLMLGIINRTKAVFAGRRGAPLLQPYFDLSKLLRKGAVYSRTATSVFRFAPAVTLAAIAVAVTMIPFGNLAAPLRFQGDLILFAGLLGLMRFAMVVAALDTGSSFEGMGASREVQFASLAEPVFYLALAALAGATGNASLSGIMERITPALWIESGPALALLGVTLLVVFLAENARIPVDDPNTHLELTMIHEVMILDHSGPDLAFMEYAAALKHWALGALLTGVLLPARTGWAAADLILSLAGMTVLCVAVGTIESTMARLRLMRVPQLLVGAGALSALAIIIGTR